MHPDANGLHAAGQQGIALAAKAGSRAAEAPVRPITTRAQQQQAERKRVVQHRRAQAERVNALVDPVRRQNKTAIAATSRDPEDQNPNRRTPRTISAFRCDDPVDRLLDRGSISRGQAWAARRLRIDYERGVLQVQACMDLTRAGGGYFHPGTGPAESTLLALERYQQAEKALGKLFPITVAAILQAEPLRDVAVKLNVNPSQASGRLFASLQALQDHYNTLTPKSEVAIRQTIGAQVGGELIATL